VRVATVSREQTPAEAVARQSHSDRPPVREEEAKPHARQGRRSVRMTLLLMVPIPLAVAVAAYYYARSQSYQSTDDAFIDDHVSNVAPKPCFPQSLKEAAKQQCGSLKTREQIIRKPWIQLFLRLPNTVYKGKVKN
jgi:cytochrome c-type biogenesis protein CcmH/NrfG